MFCSSHVCLALSTQASCELNFIKFPDKNITSVACGVFYKNDVIYDVIVVKQPQIMSQYWLVKFYDRQ